MIKLEILFQYANFRNVDVKCNSRGSFYYRSSPLSENLHKLIFEVDLNGKGCKKN